MILVGAFQAGAEGDSKLILTKSIMDGFKAIILTAGLGPGVILVYQGGLTLLAAYLKPWVSEMMLSELSGTGGVLIIMIGLNLLKLKQIKTANYVPSLARVGIQQVLSIYLINCLINNSSCMVFWN